MKILVVDDEIAIFDVINQYSVAYGYHCVGASNASKAIELVQKETFDVIVMDIMMPDMDGYQATKLIKQIKPIPVLMLSARSLEKDKLYGFDVGVDDYLTKPFSVKELMARLNVLSMRNQTEPMIVKKDLVIDQLGRSILVKQTKVNLSLKEYELLLYMVKHEGQVLSREMILNAVWKNDFLGDERTVDTHIKLLRKNCSEIKHYFITVRGVGYRFEVV